MADQEKFERLAAEWGSTAEDVEATWRAGWDIDSGPPPTEFAGKHALPPDDAEIEPTDAWPVFHNDLYPGHSDDALEGAKAAAETEYQATLAAKLEEDV